MNLATCSILRKVSLMVCISCNRLFFDRSVTYLKHTQIPIKCSLDFLKNVCPLIEIVHKKVLGAEKIKTNIVVLFRVSSHAFWPRLFR